jgi:putative membrane protein
MSLTPRGRRWSRRLPLALIALWTLYMISLPILKALQGLDALYGNIAFGVLLQAAAVAAVLLQGVGLRRTLIILAVVAALGWLAEFIGSSTGFPFGAYAYTERLQPQIGHVPVVIPLAWFMMLPPAWAVTTLLLGGDTRTISPLRFALLSAVVFTAWDLFLDPQMVAWDLWIWDTPGGYFGIPWSNYGGWLLVSALITYLVRPARLPLLPLLLVYTTTWFLEGVGLGFFWGLTGPAVVGTLVMGLFVVLSWTRLRRRTARLVEQPLQEQISS